MNAIITGASGGIGYETALLLAQQKDMNVLAVARNEKKLSALAQQSKKPIHVLPMDLTNFKERDLTDALEIINFQTVDLLINNAGLLINKPFELLADEDWLNIYTVNVLSVARLIKSLLPLMGTKNKSHIVNISSYGSFQGSAKFKGLSAYSSSKAALACLTECLAVEFAGKNIAVNCLALGAVQTEMFAAAFPGMNVDMTPAKMASYVADFAINGHQYFNGKILPVTLSTI